MNLLWELVRKDLRIYIADRRSVMISFLTPVLLACFVGYLFGLGGKTDGPKKVSIAFVDQDHSTFTKDLLAKMKESGSFDIESMTEDKAKHKVSKGDLALAIVVPEGFAAHASRAMLEHSTAPEFKFLIDPSRTIEASLSKGALIRTTMQVLTREVFGSVSATEDNQLPFKIVGESQAVQAETNSSPAAHAFAGMSMQGLLFWAIESAMTLLRERRMGLWKRLRSSPVSPFMFLLGKGISSAIRAMAILAFVFGTGFLVFHFQITPRVENYVGFGLVAIAASLMAASFGLFVAALGRNEQQSRGLSILAVLGMCMLGGAWFPMFLMPQFIQTISKAIPISWAVNGFDGMIWRGLGLTDALQSVGVLLIFTMIFGGIALKRIRWEPEPA